MLLTQIQLSPLYPHHEISKIVYDSIMGEARDPTVRDTVILRKLVQHVVGGKSGFANRNRNKLLENLPILQACKGNPVSKVLNSYIFLIFLI